jgi:hypothetical protein
MTISTHLFPYSKRTAHGFIGVLSVVRQAMKSRF